MNKSIALCCFAAIVCLITYSCDKKSDRSATAATMVNLSVDASKKVSTQSELKESEPPPTDSTSVRQNLSSSAAIEQSKDGMRFVRTADVKFQVKDVTDATYHIEDITARYGGFVTYTNLHSTISNIETLPISADSFLSITHYTVENDISLRVPNKGLDSALRAMSGLVEFLDFRVITATDVSLQALGNEMAERRNKEYEQLSIRQADDKATKQNDAVNARDRALQSREAADNAHIANLTLDNQVRYSTVHLLIYQPQTTRKVKVFNESNITRYKPSFAIQIWESLENGWDIFESFVVGIAHLWMFLLLTVIAIIAYRRFKKK